MRRYRSATFFVCTLFLALFVVAATIHATTGKDSTSNKWNTATQSGVVQSGETPVPFPTVILYKAGQYGAVPLGATIGDKKGNFTIAYKPPAEPDAVLYLIADGRATFTKGRHPRLRQSPIRLATVMGVGPYPVEIVINERTTVATAYAMAQFINGVRISGKSPGLENAAGMMQNLVNITTGEVGTVLGNSVNGLSTTTMREFNSLANLLTTSASDSGASLFSLATPPRGPAPRNTLQAMVNIAHYPWKNVSSLFALSQTSTVYEPALDSSLEPDAWTLAVRFTGNSGALDGPGNIAFDKHGNAWVNNNYVRTPGTDFGCGGNQIFKFTPTGDDAPGSPYGGPTGNNGGLYGSGFGITLDPFGDVWATNFGFTGTDCPITDTDRVALSSSVSQFDPDGNAISPSRPIDDPYGGWRSDQANIYQPQGITTDQWGNIWIANCGNASVTKIPGGNFDQAVNFSDVGVMKPFGIAIDNKGHAWVTGNGNDTVVQLRQNGSVIGTSISGGDINLPMGITVDSLGYVWIANSAAIRTPCAGELDENRISADVLDAELPPAGASVMLRLPNGKLKTFKGGGIFVPWGIVVDGDDNVWVANFAGPKSGLIGVTELCGSKTGNCPPGYKTGDPISPSTGYTSDGFTRITSVAVDPSGNVWCTNNWLIDALTNLDNPGGHEMVVLIGAAAPVKTPVAGPPGRP